MKTFLSLRKQIKTPAFIGFASSVVFHLGLLAGILGVFDRNENLEEIGLAQITMSLASINKKPTPLLPNLAINGTKSITKNISNTTNQNTQSR